MLQKFSVLPLLLLLCCFLPATAQDYKTNHSGDTLTITGAGLTADPFGFGNDPLAALTSNTRAVIHYQTVKNRHIKEQVDTLFSINLGPDQFQVYKAASKNFLSTAHLESDAFMTRHGIKVGTTKEQFLTSMKLADTLAVPQYVRLENKIVPEWIELCFEEAEVAQIEFKGYVD